MYELMLVKLLSDLKNPPRFEDWRFGTEVTPPNEPLKFRMPAKDAPLPQCMRTLTPLFADEVVTFLREKGVDNLQTAPAVIKKGTTSIGGYQVVNVLGTLSAAAFFADLPAIESFPERRRDGVQSAMRDVAALAPKVAAKREALPAPNLLVARLAEWNKPLLVRSTLARELEARRFTGLAFDDVRFASLHVGGSFYNILHEAAG